MQMGSGPDAAMGRSALDHTVAPFDDTQFGRHLRQLLLAAFDGQNTRSVQSLARLRPRGREREGSDARFRAGRAASFDELVGPHSHGVGQGQSDGLGGLQVGVPINLWGKRARLLTRHESTVAGADAAPTAGYPNPTKAYQICIACYYICSICY